MLNRAEPVVKELLDMGCLQVVVIFIPKGSHIDSTRNPEHYDRTYQYIKGFGLE